jgi:hypothetical protein
MEGGRGREGTKTKRERKALKLWGRLQEGCETRKKDVETREGFYTCWITTLTCHAAYSPSRPTDGFLSRAKRVAVRIVRTEWIVDFNLVYHSCLIRSMAAHDRTGFMAGLTALSFRAPPCPDC